MKKKQLALKTSHFLIPAFISLIAACNADPGVISDDDATPTGPGQLLECDSLPVPNSVFSNAIGETLVFTDSTGHNFDTLRCLENEAKEVKVEAFGREYCQRQYTTVFSTNWLPAPEIYSLEFKNNTLPYFTSLSAYSVPFEDFSAFDQRFTEVAGIYEAVVSVNGKSFYHVFSYNCSSSAPCTFAQAFVFSLNEGLVAIKRQDVWWTKK